MALKQGRDLMCINASLEPQQMHAINAGQVWDTVRTQGCIIPVALLPHQPFKQMLRSSPKEAKKPDRGLACAQNGSRQSWRAKTQR